jgi:FkbM family methyltransferase
MIQKVMYLLVRPVLSSLLAGLGAWSGSHRLLRKAFELNPDNARIGMELMVAEGYDRHRLWRFLLAPEFIREMGAAQARFIEDAFSDSRGQLFADLFALIQLGRKRDGFFVEIGVGDGEYLSNTWILEKKYGWRGILAEPNRTFCESIRKARTAVLDDRAVWQASGEQLAFVDVDSMRELSTLQAFQHSDSYAREGATYTVGTVTLNELLATHGAPRDIDFVSLDTEGSEWDILRVFDFEKYRVRVFAIEHNYSMDKLEKISALLAAHGYDRACPRYARFDAWYVLRG